MGLVAAAVHAVSYLALNAAINAMGHSFGTKSYPNTAFNNQWLALLTARGPAQQPSCGTDLRETGTRPPRARPRWWVIRLMVLARMATLRLTEARFVSRSSSSTIG